MDGQTDLNRFTRAHERDYERALSEIRQGRKTSHWMWYIFPQIAGLGRSETSAFYAIRDAQEAAAFLRDGYLGGHLRTICQALMALDTDDPGEVFGWPDDMKLRSCMTLFAAAAPDEPVFSQVLDKFFGGERDERTLALLSLS